MKKMAKSHRVVVAEIKDAIYRKSESDFEPNYIITKDAQKISRLKLTGVVKKVVYAGESNTPMGIVLYDGTGEILVVSGYDNQDIFTQFTSGDFVQVVGRPTLSKAGNIIVVAEGVHKVSTKMDVVHKLKVANKIKEHTELLTRAVEIYDKYGISARAFMKADAMSIPREILEAIDTLMLVKEEEQKIDEFLQGE